MSGGDAHCASTGLPEGELLEQNELITSLGAEVQRELVAGASMLGAQVPEATDSEHLPGS